MDYAYESEQSTEGSSHRTAKVVTEDVYQQREGNYDVGGRDYQITQRQDLCKGNTLHVMVTLPMLSLPNKVWSLCARNPSTGDYELPLNPYNPYQQVIDHDDYEKQAIHTVQYPTVPRNQSARILDPDLSLDHRFDQISKGSGQTYG